jgi:hypothetical protein
VKSNKQTHLMLGHSILWTAALIGSAILLRGTEQATDLFFLLFVLWGGSFVMLQDCRMQFCS